MKELLNSITFIGGGIISIEFASIVIKSGVEVNVVHKIDQILPGFNSKHVDKSVKKLEDEGVKFYIRESIKEVEKFENVYKVKTESGLSINTDYVLDATGRISKIKGIGLENVGVNYNKKGIEVDGYLRINIKNIYASGDVVDKTVSKLTPTVTFESNYIAAYILGVAKNENEAEMNAILDTNQ